MPVHWGMVSFSYVRMKNSENQIASAFVMGTSRVVPVKPVTIPRLKLSAAVMSVKIGSMLQQELDNEKVSQAYWSDSKVVLGYISNEARRFHVYVANRVQQIKEHTNTAQWHYVVSSENPADTASRGLNADKIVNNATGLNGPEFLWKESIPQSKPVNLSDMVSPEDPELKVVKSLSCKMESFRAISLLERLEFFSSWGRGIVIHPLPMIIKCYIFASWSQSIHFFTRASKSIFNIL